jgi:hypothetical protein
MDVGAIQCCITVRGRVAPHWVRWLGELRHSYRSTESNDDVTDLCGTMPDQSALRGVLNRIWNLNLTVLSLSTAADGATGNLSSALQVDLSRD